MTGAMKGFRCWSAGSVRETVYSDIGALPSDADAVFLAAHTPMSLRHLKGEETLDADSDERRVLVSLMSGIGDTDRNTLVAVTGGSGTGKSHVVRWVHAHLDHTDDRTHLLYVPRAVQTIRELLRRIVVGLPGGGGQEMMDRIDAAIGNITPAEFQDRLLEAMRLVLTWTLDPHPPGDDEDEDARARREERNNLLGDADDQGKRRHGLADLLSLVEVNRAMLRPEGRLHRLVESLYQETSRRDEQQDAFSGGDLPLREPGVRRALTGNNALRELWEIVRRDPEPALELLDDALRAALPRTLGLRAENGETLAVLFRRSRQALRLQGKDLVLLFEDLSQFGLVDGDLYDQFVTQPGQDLAPLRVLFAVTDGPYRKLPETVQTRITHRFDVGSSALANRKAFVARYLNLVRIGRSDVEASWSRATGAGSWVRNACDTREDGLPCRVRDECHRGFGDVEVPGIGRVGLYPYNEPALRRALDHHGPDATPRAILDIAVSQELIEADAHITRGTYPHDRVRERFDFRVQRAKEVVLQRRTGEQAERLYRALVLWGNEEGLAQAIVDAFSLDMQAVPAPPASVAPQVTPGSVGPTQPSPLQPLFQWESGDRLIDEDSNFYRDALHRLVTSRLDLDQDLFHTADGEGSEILNRLFNRMSFELEGARGRPAGSGNVHIRIGRHAEDVRVLIAARWFSDHGHWSPDRGTWPWPHGYDPMDLMMALECRLEQWVDTVRKTFCSRVNGRSLAVAAVGIRAVALIAAGIPARQLQHVDDVLQRPVSSAVSSPAWVPVDRTAQDVLRQISAVDWIGRFAAVRQGDRGDPQIIDAAELEKGLNEVLSSPVAFLRHVTAELPDIAPTLADVARGLLRVVEQSTPDLLGELATAVGDLATNLEGHDPPVVARAAREVGRRAKDSGLFRPADGWNAFADAIDALEALPSQLPLDWRWNSQASNEEEALAVQHWARAAVAGANALRTVRQSLASTFQECIRSGAMVGDLNERTREVRKKLGRVETLLRAISSSEVKDA